MTFRPFDLSGKTALVTGGNSGIGLAMAEGLAQAGAKVAIWGRNAEKNASALERLSVIGVETFADRVDVGEETQIVDAMARVVSRFGRLDFVSANAGVGGGGTAFVETTTDAWRRVAAVNLDGVFWTLREACRHMVCRERAGDPGGSLLVTSSTAAIHGAPRNQAYAATKAAVISLVRGIAVEHAKHGIRANALLPGWVRSEMTAGLQQWDTFNAKAIGRVPLRRWGEAEEFAGLAVYLASDASSFHTGDSFVVDGGYTIA